MTSTAQTDAVLSTFVNLLHFAYMFLSMTNIAIFVFFSFSVFSVVLYTVLRRLLTALVTGEIFKTCISPVHEC